MFYIGETIDLSQRLFEHNSGFYDRAFSSRADDWEIVLKIGCESRTQARKVERHIKQMKSRKYIENLTKYPEMVEKLKSKYKSNLPQ